MRLLTVLDHLRRRFARFKLCAHFLDSRGRAIRLTTPMATGLTDLTCDGESLLHFGAALICLRYTRDASYDSVVNARSIGVTTTDKSLRIDSVKRCKG